MSPEKTILQEVSLDAASIKTARAEPIQQDQPGRSMDFIRNFILGIPLQGLRETESPEPAPTSVAQGDLDSIKRLAGIKQ